MKSIRVILVFVLWLASLGQITADLYLPSLPAIMRQLHATQSLTQLTVAFFMLGFSVFRLIFGPLSDAYGRKKPLFLFGSGFVFPNAYAGHDTFC